MFLLWMVISHGGQKSAKMLAVILFIIFKFLQSLKYLDKVEIYIIGLYPAELVEVGWIGGKVQSSEL